MQTSSAFADLHDDIDALSSSPAADRSVVIHSEPCGACKGSGRFFSYTGRLVGKCFKCGGSGKLEFKTPAHVRAQNRAKAVVRKVEQAASKWDTFAAAHPDQAAFLSSSSFDFAVAMVEAVKKFGSLTDNQMGAVNRCMEKAAARVVTREQNSTAINVDTIKAAFDAAKASGLKRPGIVCGPVDFSLAPDHGRNPGAIYCKVDGNYVGMIVAGQFKAGRDCTAEHTALLVRIAQDPKAAAIEHGKMTGRCSCCNRLLTDPVSVANGIGPICASRFGW